MWLNGIHVWRSLTLPLVAGLLAVCLGPASAEPGVPSADALSQEDIAREREALGGDFEITTGDASVCACVPRYR